MRIVQRRDGFPRWVLVGALALAAAAGVAAFVFSVGGFASSVFGTSQVQPPAPPPAPVAKPTPAPVPVRVTYEVTGWGAASMSFTDKASRTVDMGSMPLPWVHDELVDPSFMAAAVSGASADPSVVVACRITVGGKQVAANQGVGAVKCTQGD